MFHILVYPMLVFFCNMFQCLLFFVTCFIYRMFLETVMGLTNLAAFFHGFLVFPKIKAGILF
jgi:hypothetical protein